MNKVIDFLGMLFKILLAVLLFVLVQLAVIYAFRLLDIDTGKYEGLFSLIYSLLTIGIFLIYHKIRTLKSKSLILFDRPDGFSLLSAFVIGFGLLGVVTIYLFAAYEVADYFEPLQDALERYSENIDRFAQVEKESVPYWDNILSFISDVFLITLAEELVFRGIVFGEINRRFNYIVSSLGSALVFGLLHGISVHIVYALICGVVLAFVYYYSGSIWVSYTVHAVFNFMGSALMTLLDSGIFGDLDDAVLSISYHSSVFEIICILPAVAAFILMRRLHMQRKEPADEQA
ncbi:MAG: CPBP family intramembrane metalloprotease [Clostridiales bacterium]|nr:CPBP family intramembrane metalloprotease [Clostridiales bacterium]